MKAAAKLAVTVGAYLAGLVLVALMLGTVADVAGRYFFNAPILGVFDLTHFAVVIMVYLGMGYCTYYGAHAAIELLYNRLPAALAGLVSRLADLAGAVMFAIIAWRTGAAGLQVQDFGQTSQLLLLPLYPLYWVIVVGCVLVVAVLLMHAIAPNTKEKDQAS
jgi:TRAP-type C4-dicarboxylate transport system permease small subunit